MTRWTRFVATGLLVTGTALASGCGESSGPPGTVNPDDFVEKKVQAMEKIATVVEQKGDEADVITALEDYRAIPFEPKKQQETAKKILDIYKKRIAPKVKGEAAIHLKGDMNLLEYEMKN